MLRSKFPKKVGMDTHCLIEEPAPGYRFITDEELDDIIESCDPCQGGYTSCYHCGKCGGSCSLMGHQECKGVAL